MVAWIRLRTFPDPVFLFLLDSGDLEPGRALEVA